MEMHQVRYFLAVAKNLNFTRGAEECNVSQPSLTRAIKQLESEFGGDLFRRERPQAQLTELGERMLPLLKQCYDSAVSARELALSMKKGEVASLRLALSHTFDINLLMPHLNEVRRRFERLECRLLRGTAPEVVELLEERRRRARHRVGPRRGLGPPRSLAAVHRGLRPAGQRPASSGALTVDRAAELREERLLLRTYCEHADATATLLRSHGLDVDHSYQITSESDLMSMLASDLGVAIVPRSTSSPDSLARVMINGLELSRPVHLYGVAGRQRTAVAALVMKMLRAANWSQHVG